MLSTAAPYPSLRYPSASYTAVPCVSSSHARAPTSSMNSASTACRGADSDHRNRNG
ncbi:hypothetical protein H9P43_005313 [Blastocladiella emersonii ATCC 22665]|nr:hypothetical protein H9P43_005313 [Blastocladiella emersonii ATCC 22665]